MTVPPVIIGYCTDAGISDAADERHEDDFPDGKILREFGRLFVSQAQKEQGDGAGDAVYSVGEDYEACRVDGLSDCLDLVDFRGDRDEAVEDEDGDAENDK